MFIRLWISWWVGTWSQLPWWNWDHLDHLIKSKKAWAPFSATRKFAGLFLKQKKNHLVEEVVIDLALQQGFCMLGIVTVLYPARTTIHGQIWVHSSIFVCRVLPQEVALSVFQLFLSWITISTRKIQKWYLSYESDMKACLGGWTSIKGSIIVDIIVVIKVAKNPINFSHTINPSEPRVSHKYISGEDLI